MIMIRSLTEPNSGIDLAIAPPAARIETNREGSMSRHESGRRLSIATHRSSGSVLLLLMLAVLSGCSEPQASPPQPRPVRFVTVKREEHNLFIQGSGQVKARYVSAVGFLISGRLVSRVVDVGSPVKAGDLIAKIDATDYQNRLVAAQSQVVSAQASLD